MNVNNILSYITKVKPIRVRIFIPFEIWGLMPTLVATIFSTLVYFISSGWGILLYMLTAACFLLANSIRNVEAGQTMVTIVLNKPSEKVKELGVKWVIPFITLCDYYTVTFVREEVEIPDLETKGDGYHMRLKVTVNKRIIKKYIYLFAQDVLRGKEEDLHHAQMDGLLEASKNEVKRYSHEDLVERDTNLQEKLKADIEANFLRIFAESLERMCGHRDLYDIDLIITNLMFDQKYMDKLSEKNQAAMDKDIAVLDKEAAMREAEAKAYEIDKLGEALRRNPEVTRYETAKHSNLQNIVGDGARMLLGDDKPKIITP